MSSLSGTPSMIAATVGVVNQAVELGEPTRFLSLVNSHPTQDAFVSFDGGAKFLRLPANGGAYEGPIRVRDFIAKGSAAGTTLEGVAVH